MTALVGPRRRQGVALLDEAQQQAVLAYCNIAAASGALLSVEDLLELLAIDATPEQIEESISSDELLASKVFVEAGHVLLRSPGSDRETARQAAKEEGRRRKRALANVEAARVFARMLSKDAIFVAVAGTNSYLSAAEGDDIDFYCITKTDRMWAFMLKSLLLSKVSALVRKPDKPFCFSFVLDEKQAMEELSRPKDALFARDTLTAKVISGGGAMYPILEKATWMRSYFPSLYERKLREMGPAEGRPPWAKKRTSLVNSWLYLTLGSYVALKAWILNRTLAKQGRPDAIFKAKIGPGQLEYASRRYVELGKMYQVLEKR
jgi:hypothetical protein